MSGNVRKSCPAELRRSSFLLGARYGLAKLVVGRGGAENSEPSVKFPWSGTFLGAGSGIAGITDREQMLRYMRFVDTYRSLVGNRLGASKKKGPKYRPQLVGPQYESTHKFLDAVEKTQS